MDWSEYVYLAPDSPTWLRWKINILDTRGHQTKARKDGVAGGGGGRYQVQVGAVQEQCSRVVYKLMHGDIPQGLVVDHKDGNCLNNDPENLLLKTLTKNNRNVKKSTQNTSGKVGVYWTKNRSGTICAEACWYEGGKKVTRKFSTQKYGKSRAFAMASEIRDAAIARMNEEHNAGYTERHGA